MAEIFQIGSEIFNMLESQSIAWDFPASQELWNTPSQVCSIAACGSGFKALPHDAMKWAIFLRF